MEKARSRNSSRKTHNKTRTGCKTCKTRRIKCDETRPSCVNCVKYGVSCDFVQDGPSTRTRSPASGSENESVDPHVNLLDLELMHYWTTSTCQTLTDGHLGRNFWRHNMVKVGFGCEFVMHGILALAALHLAHTCPEREPELIEKSVHHHDLASKQAMAQMAVVEEARSQEMADNLFCFACITMYIALANSHNPEDALLTDDSQTPNWVTLFDGTRHLNMLSRDSRTRHHLVHPIIEHALRRDEVRRDPPHHPYLEPLRERIAKASLDPGVRRIYDHAIDELYASFGTFYKTDHQHDILDLFLWVARVISDFMPLLRNPSQETLAIFSYFCMLPKRMPRQWWLNRWADSLKIRTYELLDAEHRAWVVEPSTIEMPYKVS